MTTAGEGGYTAAVQKIYGVPPPPPEEHHEAIDNLNNIDKGMQTHSSDLEGMKQANVLLTRSNSAVRAQLAHMTIIKMKDCLHSPQSSRKLHTYVKLK